MGSDKVNVSLNQGWNSLLLKITQNQQGWEFCARLINGSGIKYATVTYRHLPSPTATYRHLPYASAG